MAARRVVIVHGTGGSPQENWFPWLAASLEEFGVATVVPQFPDPEHQSPASWRSTLLARTDPVGPDCVLVGHSIGAAFILRLLEEASHPVAGTVLASGFIGALGNEFDGPNAPFFEAPFDWPAIRQAAGAVSLFFGDDDPYVPLPSARALADGLEHELHLVPSGGHLNRAAGYTAFPAVLDAVKELI